MTLTRSPLFWLSFTLASLVALGVGIRYFPKAFPIVNLELNCNRPEALAKAMAVAHEYHLGPDNPSQTAVFLGDNEVKTFVELEAGGKPAFAQMLKDNYYSPYSWYVRHFREYEKNETLIRLKPDGTPYGFLEELSENEKGAALEQDAARAIVEKIAPAWHINLAEYALVEQSKETKPSGRIDHTFMYERPDVRIGAGYYRLKFTVSGDKLTEITHSVKVPEAFTLRYKEMRSANNSIATAAQLALMLLYVIGCCIIALFFFLRRNAILWRTPLFWGVLVAGLHLLVEFNQLPLQWFEYPTALSTQGFILKLCIAFLYQFLTKAALYSVSFMAAESLTRAAFGDHIQLWKTWLPTVASSWAMLGRTIAGYLLVPIFLCFTVVFYLFSTQYWGWWTPSDSLIDPNILAHYFPWLSSIVYSLGAGFWEECLFRAVPLATGALIGQRFGNRSLWISIAFILQIIIFGAAHANYPGQPAYARVVELIFFSAAAGLIYLRFGLIPTIVAHFTYDVMWFALPVFVSSAAGSWLNQALIILLALIPLWVVLYGRYKTGSFHALAPEYLNKAWQPPVTEQQESRFKLPTKSTAVMLHTYIQPIIIACGVLGAGLWLGSAKRTQDAPAISVTTDQAIAIAHKNLEQKKITPSPAWQTLTKVNSDYTESKSDELQHLWIWQKGGQDLYRSYVGTYLKPPRIIVRSATFSHDVPVADRAEEFLVAVAQDGKIVRSRHVLPENKAGASLDEAQARAIAQQELKNNFNLDPQAVKEISATADKKPDRKDWTFIFENKADYPLAEGQARIIIMVAGDEVVDAMQYVHVPEAWERHEQNRQNLLQVITLLCSLLIYLLFCLGLLILLRHSHAGLNGPQSFTYFIPLIGLFIITIINGWPSLIAVLNTSEPYKNQLFMLLTRYGFASMLKAAALSFVIAGLMKWRLPYKPHTHRPIIFGTCLGFFVAGLYAVAEKLFPALSPTWAHYEELGNYLPWLGEITSAILAYLALTAIIMLIYVIVDYITNYWQEKKWLGALTFIGLGILINGMHNLQHISSWIIGGVGIGVLLAFIYVVIARYDREALPIIVGIFWATQLAQQALFKAYPGALVGYALSIIVVLALAYWWTVSLARVHKE